MIVDLKNELPQEIAGLPQSDFAFVQDGQIHDEEFRTKPIGFYRDAMQRLCSNRVSMISLFLILLIALLSIIVPEITGYGYAQQNVKAKNLPPKIPVLEDMGIASFVISKETTGAQLAEAMQRFRPLLEKGKQVAFVVRKGALEYDGKTVYRNEYTLTREEAIRRIAAAAGPEDVIVSTTGKASRELFEIREARGEGHESDFLTVGSMGHSSSIAMGIALQQPRRRVIVIDGDGAVLMHMGSLALMGANRPGNVIHLVINNGAHETVGGMPTVAGSIDMEQIARGCGYPHAECVRDAEALDASLARAMARRELTLIEVRCAIGSRPDLGRPTTTAMENKQALMGKLLGDRANQ